MKIALLYDRINRFGGAERVLLALHELFPDAPIYTLVHDVDKSSWSKKIKIIPSWMQKIPFAKKNHEWYPVIPVFAYETMDFSGYDIVISVTSTEAKGIITSPKIAHICYCLTPSRYLWTHYNDYFQHSWLRFFGLPFVAGLRIWDQFAANRSDAMVAISKTVANRIYKFYRRDAQVIYPPVDTDIFTVDYIPREDFLLVVSRAVKYKHIELAIASSNELNIPLKVVGVGDELNALRKISGSKTEFLGDLTDDELIHYYRRCRALLFPQEEDFGIAAVEAMACGAPVVAYGKGGATETVISGLTGEFFYSHSVDSMVEAIAKSGKTQYSPKNCRKQAIRFSKKIFKKNFSKLVDKYGNKSAQK